MHCPFFMLNKLMYFSKNINGKLLKKYFFVKGKIEIDSNYFIKKIKNSCNSKENWNYKTNVKGLMTSPFLFCHDLNFLKILKNFIEYIDSKYNLPHYHLKEAWGIQLNKGEKTEYHDHIDSLWSGVIYLNSSNQKLIFPEIKEEVKPEIGSFALFSNILSHGCNVNNDNYPKFAISFNLYQTKNW